MISFRFCCVSSSWLISFHQSTRILSLDTYSIMCFWKRRQDGFDFRAFFEAVQFGDTETVERMLSARSTEDNQPLRDGNVVDPEVHMCDWSVWSDFEDWFFLNFRSWFFSQLPFLFPCSFRQNGQSGLHIVAMTGNEDMASLLLQKYIADSNIRDKVQKRFFLFSMHPGCFTLLIDVFHVLRMEEPHSTLPRFLVNSR